MKTLWVALVVLVLATMPATAAEDARPTVKYEVKIEVIYNAVTADEMAKIIGEAAVKHEGACKVAVSGKKVDNNLNVSNGTGWVTFVPLGTGASELEGE